MHSLVGAANDGEKLSDYHKLEEKLADFILKDQDNNDIKSEEGS